MSIRRAAFISRVLVCAALCLALVDGPGVALGDGRSGADVDGPLQRIAHDHPNDTVRVLVQSKRRGEAERAVQHAAASVKGSLPRVHAIAVEMRADQVDRLAHEPGLVRVMLDPAMHGVTGDSSDSSQPLNVYPQTVGASTLWSYGMTGRGVGIGVLDSGVQAHRDLGNPSRVVVNQRFNAGASSSADQFGHGTWVAGIAAGDGSASEGRYVGVAPQASIINLKVSDDTGAAHASDVLQALMWVIDHHAEYNIRVVNLSFVSGLAEGYATSVLDAAVEMVWHSGVVVVVAAGNRGPNTLQYAPANDPYVISVGATDEAGTASPADDTLAWFSSFGLTQAGFAKPDLVAPGRHIVGALASNGAGLASEFPAKVVNQQYIQLSGTSASAPVVSGAVALLLQGNPDLKPDQVKWLLTHTARPLASNSTGSGAGELDVVSALRSSNQAGRANLGLTPNQLVALLYLNLTGNSTVSWDSVSWVSVGWDSVSWDSVSWDSVSWDSVSWDSVSWDSVSWDSVVGD